MNKDAMTLAASILCCPDCQTGLTAALVCRSCNRSLAPAEDGIISALPKLMEDARQGKDQLQSEIDAAGPGGQSANIVLYEKAFHDEQARYYDKLFGDPLPLGKYYKHLVGRQIYSYVRKEPFVVDLCCGTGKSSMPLVEQGIVVVGMDVSREMLRIYKRKCDANGYSNVILVHTDASRPPLRKESCGAITLIGGLHHIPEQQQCLAWCCGALSKNGVLILHEPLKMGTTSAFAKLLDNVYALTDPHRVVRALRRRLGLKVQAPASAPVEEAEPDFTPYEKPLTSPQELLASMPSGMRPLSLRSQGQLSFRNFPPYLQSRLGLPLASVIVRLDQWLSGSSNWSGDALFAVMKKDTVTTSNSGDRKQTAASGI